MPIQSFDNNDELAQIIRDRRLELNLLVQEASNISGVGIKTWNKYESGSPIREG